MAKIPQWLPTASDQAQILTIDCKVFHDSAPIYLFSTSNKYHPLLSFGLGMLNFRLLSLVPLALCPLLKTALPTHVTTHHPSGLNLNVPDFRRETLYDLSQIKLNTCNECALSKA